MNSIQTYLKFLERLKLRQLVSLILITYLSIVFLFGLIYYFGELVSDTDGNFWNYIYFSFITQSTVGYGDLKPIGLGRLLVIIQTTSALFLFALGTGAIIFRMLTPSNGSILFDDNLLFYPNEKRFKFRYVNKLSIKLVMASLAFRLRHYRTTSFSEKKVSRKTIMLLQSIVTQIPSLQPLLSSTFPIEDQKALDEYGMGNNIILEPQHLDKDCKVTLTLTAQYFSGNIVATKEWTYDNIYCGKYESTYDMPSKIEWEKWNKFIPTGIDKCEKCNFNTGCILKEKL